MLGRPRIVAARLAPAVARGCNNRMPSQLCLARPFAADTFLAKDDVAERIMMVVKNHEKVDEAKVLPTVVFKDLGLDSLDTVEVVMSIEEEFAIEIPDLEADKILSISEAVDYIASHPMAK